MKGVHWKNWRRSERCVGAGARKGKLLEVKLRGRRALNHGNKKQLFSS